MLYLESFLFLFFCFFFSSDLFSYLTSPLFYPYIFPVHMVTSFHIKFLSMHLFTYFSMTPNSSLSICYQPLTQLRLGIFPCLILSFSLHILFHVKLSFSFFSSSLNINSGQRQLPSVKGRKKTFYHHHTSTP